MLAALLLAAGASQRMKGQDKLLELVDGHPLLVRQARALRAADLPLWVTVNEQFPNRRKALEGLDVHIVSVEEPEKGMGQSIACGVAAIPDAYQGVMIVPTDMPELRENDFREMSDAWQKHPDTICRATSQERPGHPVVFPRRCFAGLRQLTGDIGAQNLLARERIQKVPLPGIRATLDLDTPETWADWRDR